MESWLSLMLVSIKSPSGLGQECHAAFPVDWKMTGAECGKSGPVCQEPVNPEGDQPSVLRGDDSAPAFCFRDMQSPASPFFLKSGPAVARVEEDGG